MPELRVSYSQNQDRNFVAERTSFFDGAQDSYTTPPSQNMDMFERLWNVLPPSVQGSLARRWGYQLWSSDSTVVRRLYEFQQQAGATRRIIGTAADGTGASSATNKVVAYNEDGSVYLSPIFTPSASATSPRMVSSRDYAFFADSVQADLQKWNGALVSGLTNWGIVAPTTPIVVSPILGGGSSSFPLTAVANAVAGNTTYTGTGLTAINTNTTVVISGFSNAANNGTFTVVSTTATTLVVNNPSGISATENGTALTQNSFYPTVSLNGWGPNAHVGSYEGGVNQGYNFGLDGGTTGSYSNPANAFDGKDTTFASASGQSTHAYFGCVWSFSTPAVAITNPVLNVLSEVPISGTDGQTVTARSSSVWYSLNGGTSWNSFYDVPSRPKQWDHLTLPAGQDISKVQVMAFTDSHDNMYHKVYEINIQATVVGNGPITLTKGRQYFLSYTNSNSGHFSDVSPISSSTGVVEGGSVPLSSLAVSTDPQVNNKVILATADGGDTSVLYFLAQVTNATTSYLDTTPELTLLSNNVYGFIDASGNEFGVYQNQPPPNGQFPTKHRGRIYMLQGQNIVFSKSLAEVTTPTTTVAGRYEEAWPAQNTFDISVGAETGRALLTDGDFLYIGTDRHVLRLVGDGPQNFEPPQTAFNEGGVLNQDCWRSVFIDGSPLGSMWITPDYRVYLSDFNTHRDVGLPIQDVLNSINTAANANVYAQYYALGAFNLYVLAIPTGVNTDLDTLCVYDLKAHKWYVWFPTDKVTSLVYNINASGTPQIIFWSSAAAASRGYKFVPGLVQDRVNNTPINFTSTVRTSWLDFSLPTLRKVLNWLQVVSDDLQLTITIEGASTTADFSAPHTVVSNGGFKNSPFGDLTLYLADKKTKDRYYRFTMTTTGSTTVFLRAFLLHGFGWHSY